MVPQECTAALADSLAERATHEFSPVAVSGDLVVGVATGHRESSRSMIVVTADSGTMSWIPAGSVRPIDPSIDDHVEMEPW
jgi:hypothetical protein